MYLIVGIDPGTTVGIAGVDFRGNVRCIFGSKDMGLRETVRYLEGLGCISVIASDTRPVSKFLLKLSAKFDATLFIPERSISIKEKMKLAKGYNILNSHERDALSAALNAYNKIKNRLDRMDSRGMNDKMKHIVLQGYSMSAAKNMKNENLG